MDTANEGRLGETPDNAQADACSAAEETSYLNSVPGLADAIIEGMRTPFSVCLEESDVKW